MKLAVTSYANPSGFCNHSVSPVIKNEVVKGTIADKATVPEFSSTVCTFFGKTFLELLKTERIKERTCEFIK